MISRMENYFYAELNRNTVEAVNRGTAFFMNPQYAHIPPINDAYTGTLITGVNYFNLNLRNDIQGTRHTEYVNGDSYTAGNRAAAPQNNYVPFQSNNATMHNFTEFVHEQFANAINASLANCPFKSNINERDMDQFKTKLINEITKNPSFMAGMVNRANEEVMNFHYLPFDRNNFIERARNENSPEFMRLNSAVSDHVHDMYHNQRNSFNPAFNELSRPLILHMGNMYQDNPAPAVNREITEFIRKQIRQDRTATIVADVFAGTLVEKAIKLVRTGKRIFAGIVLAGAIFNDSRSSHDPIVSFCRNTAQRMGDASHSRFDDFVKVAGNIMTSQELRGDRSLAACRDQNNPHSFYVNLNQLIRDNPKVLDQAVAQVNNSRQHRTQSVERGQAMRR